MDPELVMALRAQVADEFGAVDAQLRALMLRADVLREAVIALDALANLPAAGDPVPGPRSGGPLPRRADLHPDPVPPPPEEPDGAYDGDRAEPHAPADRVVDLDDAQLVQQRVRQADPDASYGEAQRRA